jgi:hypothetical protein
MMPAAPVSRTRRTASRSEMPPATTRSRPPSAPARRSPRSPRRRSRGPGRSAGRRGPQARTGGREGWAARRDASGRPRAGPPGIQAHGEPVARHIDAGAEELGVVGDRERGHHAGRPGGEGDADRLRRIETTGELERRRDPRRDGADGVRVDRGAVLRAPSKSTRWINGAPRLTKCSAIALRPVGRWHRCPSTPRAQRRRGGGPFSMSIAGITSTG